MTPTPSVYVSTWSQEKILDYFWLMLRQDADKIELLRQLAGVAVARPSDWSCAAIREAHQLGRPRRFEERCFCCITGDRRLYWHHVIPIANGGDNTRTNLVSICQRCHAAIHPWLDPNEPHQQRSRRAGFESIRDIMMREFDKLAKGEPVGQGKPNGE